MSLRSMTTIKDTLHILDDVPWHLQETMGHFKLVEWNAILVKLLNVCILRVQFSMAVSWLRHCLGNKQNPLIIQAYKTDLKSKLPWIGNIENLVEV